MLETMPKSQRERLLGMIQDRFPGYHPLISIAEIAHDPEADIRTQLSCHQTIIKYVESELKSLEVKAEIHEEKVVRVSLFEGEYEVLADPIPGAIPIEHKTSHMPLSQNVMMDLMADD